MSKPPSLEGSTRRGRRYRCVLSTNAAVIEQLGAAAGDGTDRAAWDNVVALFGVAYTPPAPWTVYDVAWREPRDTAWQWRWTILHVPSINRVWVYKARQSFTGHSLAYITAAIVDRHIDNPH